MTNNKSASPCGVPSGSWTPPVYLAVALSFLLFALPSSSSAQDICVSVADGDWTAGATWEEDANDDGVGDSAGCPGTFPSSGDKARVQNNVNVNSSTGDLSIDELVIEGSGVLTIIDGTTLTVAGSVTNENGLILDQGSQFNSGAAPGTIAIGGDFSQPGGMVTGDNNLGDGEGVVLFNGNTGAGSPQSVSGNFTGNTGGNAFADLQLTGDNTFVTFSSDLDVVEVAVGESGGTSPTFTLNSNLTSLGGTIDNHGTFDGSSGRLETTSPSTISGTSTVSVDQYIGQAALTIDGSFLVDNTTFSHRTSETLTVSTGGTLETKRSGSIQGDFVINGNFISNGVAVNFNGVSAQTVSGTGSITGALSEIIVDNGSSLTLNDFTYASDGSGSISLSDGDLVLNSTLDPAGSQLSFTSTSSISGTGSFTSAVGGISVSNTSDATVDLDVEVEGSSGGGDISVASNSSLSFGNGVVTTLNASGADPIDVTGIPNFANLTVASGTDVTFSTINVAESLTIDGTVGGGDIVLDGTNSQTVSGAASPIEIARLELDNSSGAVLNSALTITDELTLTDGTFTTNGNLTLPTSPDGGGNTIDDIGGITRVDADNDGNLDGTLSGNVTLERRFGTTSNTRGTAEDEGQWRQISSPSNTINFSSLNTPFSTQGHAWADNPDGDDILFSYNPNTDSYVAEDTDAGFEAGTGYFFFAFENDINNPAADILPTTWSIAAGENTDGQSPDFTGATTNDFVMAGNPFFGFLDWDAVHGNTATDINDTYQVWDPDTNTYQSYTVGGADTAPDVTDDPDLQYIPPAQGFWVEVTGSSPALTFNRADTDKPDGSGGTLVFESTEAPPLPFVVLNIEGDGIGSGLAMHFRDDSEFEVDNTDAQWLPPFSPTYITMWSEVEGERFTVDNRPELRAGETATYDLGVSTTVEGDYTLTWPQFNRIPADWNLSVTDNVTGEIVDMRVATEYTFTVSTDATVNTASAAMSSTGPAMATTQTATDAPRFTVEISAAPLPVELARFDASTSGTSAVLEWSTASETNNSGFYVQQKQDGAFVDLGFVEGAGTTDQPQSYRFRVNDLEEATEHTFRLKQVDLDGTEHLTETQSVRIGLGDAYRLATYPNPFQDRATVEFAVKDAQPVTIELYNTLGQRVQTVFEGTAQAEEMLTETIDGSRLASGLYIVRLKGERFTATRKITLVR